MKKNKRTIEQEIKKDKIILLITMITIVVLLSLLIVSKNYRDFGSIKLRTNEKSIFSISDLTIDELKYGSTESEVRKEFGTPEKEKKVSKDKYSYKELYYDGLKLTLKENYDDYMITSVEITSNKYNVSRNIKVSNNILKTMKKFKIENKEGSYMYGNYSLKSLDSDEINENIYFGLRDSSKVLYVNKDAKTSDLQSNIAKLLIYYNHGKVTKIIWTYDFE